MAGQVGRWWIFPVTLAVMFVGFMLISTELVNLRNTLTERKYSFTVNELGTLKAEAWPRYKNEQFPYLAKYRPVPFILNLIKLQRITLFIAGAWTFVCLFFARSFLARILVGIGIVYVALWLTTHFSALYAFRQKYFFEFEPEWRKDHVQAKPYLFGVKEWPATFWYTFFAGFAFQGPLAYLVLNLWYSYALIMRVGGSAWEGLPANQLPGWRKYQKEKADKRRARHKRIYGESESESEGSEAEFAERQALLEAPDLGAEQEKQLRAQALAMKQVSDLKQVAQAPVVDQSPKVPEGGGIIDIKDDEAY